MNTEAQRLKARVRRYYYYRVEHYILSTLGVLSFLGFVVVLGMLFFMF